MYVISTNVLVQVLTRAVIFSTPQSLIFFQVLNILGDRFGFTNNSKGYKMLPDCIRVIQGDGVSYETLEAILANMKKHKWSAGTQIGA